MDTLRSTSQITGAMIMMHNLAN
uniref:Uncharacterized protein n=2 Tax=Anguilla anguilla TaxID=7936 RepID=A0A0E9QAC8_ANGAN